MLFKFFLYFLVPGLSLLVTQSLAKPVKKSLEKSNNREKLFMDIKNSMNFNVDPCDDYYEYVCGNYATVAPRAEFEPYVGNLFNLQRKVLKQENDLLSQTNYDESELSETEIKTINFYKSCMDKERINNQGLDPLLNVISKLGNFPALDYNWSEEDFDWVNLTANLKLYGVEVFIVENVVPLEIDKNKFILQIAYPEAIDLRIMEIGEEIFERVKSKEKERIEETLSLFDVGYSAARDIADELTNFYFKYAQIVPKPISVISKEITIQELMEKLPGINWETFLSIVTQKEINQTDLLYLENHENYFEKLTELITNTPKRTVANYLMWKFIDTIYISEKTKKRNEKCTEFAILNLDPGVAALYIRQHFNERAKDDIFEMMNELKNTFKESITTSEWLDDDTKNMVKEKVDKLQVIVGYQDFLGNTTILDEDYKSLEIDPENYYQNVFNIARHNIKLQHSNLKIWDKRIFRYPHSQVNAYYDILHNTIFIPPGILQPPVYHPDFPKAWFYAAVGAFVGHEFIHAFDTLGRQFNADGVIENWWSKEAESTYIKDSVCFIDQYNNYTVPGISINVNGNYTLTENIADNGALRHMFKTYKKWLKENENSDIIKYETVPGLNMTSEEMFFTGFANIWCDDANPLFMSFAMQLDIHSPSRVRTNGVLANMKEFSETFNCPDGAPMNPSTKCVIW